MDRILVGIPVYNESKHVQPVLEAVRRYATDVLVIDDGSTDSTPMELAQQPVEVIRHAQNRGYGRAMQELLRRASFDGYDWLVTMDCDFQHEPDALPSFFEAISQNDADLISGSRYLADLEAQGEVPQDRRSINHAMTQLLNGRLDLCLTDSFCGFKAYRTISCASLPLSVDGYDFPIQFWVQSVAHGLRIREIPVRLIYNDPTRTFGGPLDQADNRHRVYEATFETECGRWAHRLPMAMPCT